MFFALLFSLSALAAPWPQIFSSSQIEWGVELPAAADFSKNKQAIFLPASTAKILTAATALQVLGPEFHFQTTLSWGRVNSSTISELQLVSDGDPTPGMEEFGESLTSRTENMLRLFMIREFALL